MNLCDDNRIITIEKAKQELIKGTNIEDSPEEMKVLDNILFRCWQMGWLDRYDPQMPSNTSNALEALDSVNAKQSNALDSIRRQAAIKALDKRFDSIPMEQTTEILLLRRDLRELPPANNSEIPNTSMTEVATDINVGDKDTISRKAAINALGELITGSTESGYAWFYTDDVYKAIKQLPPAQPEPYKGVTK